jgi:hypothetical protein
MPCFRWLPLMLAGCMLAGTALAADPPASPATHKGKAVFGNGGGVDVHAPPVGVGTHMGPRPTAPGMYFDDKDRHAAQEWFQSHPVRDAAAVNWAIGQPLPAGTPVKPVPTGLLGVIRKQPPGFHYVAAGNTILVVANASKLVVDAISAQ